MRGSNTAENESKTINTLLVKAEPIIFPQFPHFLELGHEEAGASLLSVLDSNKSKLANFSMEEKKAEQEESPQSNILIKKERGMEMRKKGKLVKLRPRSRMTKAERDANIKARLIEKLSQPVADQISDQWERLETGKGQKDQNEGDGIIKNLLSLGLAYNEIQMLLSCGKGRICRLNNPERYKNVKEKQTSWNSITVEDKSNFVAFFENLETETGFACAHRQPMKYTTEQGLN